MSSVTEDAVLSRCNRKLSRNYEQVLKCRPGTRSHHCLGRYYRMDRYRNVVVDTHIDLEKLARSLNVIRPDETISSK